MSEPLTGDNTNPRPGAQRKADVMEKLTARRADAWVASASETGAAHLVPLSLAWNEDRVMLVTPLDSATARNIARARAARLALGGTRDVVMIDAQLDEAETLAETSSELADAYAQQADWDPRSAGGDYVVLLLRPHRIQAWREANEIDGRTLMREGQWLF